MDPTEERLRALLHRETPYPPFALDTSGFGAKAQARERQRRLVPALVTAAVLAIVAVVVGGVMLVGGANRGDVRPAVRVTPTAPAPTPTTGSVAPTTTPSTTGSAPAAPVGPTGGPVPAGFTPSSATFVSADVGWVLGTAPCTTAPCTSMVRTRDGGRTWVGIPAPKDGLASSTLQPSGVSVVRFADQRNGWAFGPDLWSTHDGGATWTRRAVPQGGRVQALETSGGIVVALVASSTSTGGGAPTVWGTRVGSDTFAQQGGPVAVASVADLAVTGTDWFVTGGDAVVHGTGVGGGSPVTLPAPCTVSGFAPAAISAVDADHLDVLCEGDGAAGSSAQYLAGSADGARTWVSRGSPQVQEAGVGGISDNGDGVLLVARASGNSTIARTTDVGASYTGVLTVASGGTAWGDVGFTTATQAVAVLAGSAAYLSRDAGVTWSQVTFR